MPLLQAEHFRRAGVAEAVEGGHGDGFGARDGDAAGGAGGDFHGAPSPVDFGLDGDFGGAAGGGPADEGAVSLRRGADAGGVGGGAVQPWHGRNGGGLGVGAGEFGGDA